MSKNNASFRRGGTTDEGQSLVVNRKFSENKFFCHEDSDDDEVLDDAVPEKQRMVSETMMNQVIAGREKKWLKQVEKKIQGMNYASSEQIAEMLSKLKDDAAGAVEVESNKTPTSSGENENLPPGFKAELDKVVKQLNVMQEDNVRLQQDASDKEQAMLMERRQHNTESILSASGAVRPDQCYTILKDKIVSDEELGDSVSVKTEHGDDIVSVKNYIMETFKEENPHLFTNPAKSGSGAGAGSGINSKKSFNADSLKDPKDGGMSWESYEKNRDAIIADWEQNKRK